MPLFFYQDNISMEFPICRLTVKELREIAKKMGLAHKGLKKCQLILLLERNGANQQEPEELEFPDVEVEYPDEVEYSDVEVEYPDVVTQRLRFGDTKKDIIPYSKTKGRKSRGTKSTRTLTEEDLKNFIPRNVLKKQAKKNKFFELEEAVPSQSMYSKKPIDIKRNWNTNYKVGKYLPTLEFEDKDNLDPYKILGISKSASLKDIRNAYMKKSRIYHPDRLSSKTKEEQERGKEMFQLINNAYQYILDDKEDDFDIIEVEKARKEYEDFKNKFQKAKKTQDDMMSEREKEYEEIEKERIKYEEKRRPWIKPGMSGPEIVIAMNEYKKNRPFEYSSEARKIVEKYLKLPKKDLIKTIYEIMDKRNIKDVPNKFDQVNRKSKASIKNMTIPDLIDLILMLEGFNILIEFTDSNVDLPDQTKDFTLTLIDKFGDELYKTSATKSRITKTTKAEERSKKYLQSKKPKSEESDELDFSDVIFEKEPESSKPKPKKSKPAPIIEYTEDEMEDLQNTINILLDSPKEELNQIILEETGQDASNLTEEQLIKKILIDVHGNPANIVNKMKIRLKKSTQQQSKQQSQPSQKQKSTLVNIQIINEKDYRKMMNKPLSATIQRAYEEMLTNKQFDKSNEIQEYVAEKLKEEGIIKY